MDITDVFLPQSLNGSLTRGGTIISGQLVGDTDGLEYGRNVQLQGISGAGGSLDPAYRTFFDGHCLTAPDNIQFDKYTSTAMIQIGTMDNLLKGHLQDIGFTEQASPQNSHQITGMSIADIVDHILRRHCNAVYHATQTPDGVITDLDVDTTNSTPLTLRNVRKSNHFWRRLQELGGGERAGEFYRCWFDRRNKFYYQPAPAFFATPPSSKGTLTNEHIRGRVRVKVHNADPATKIGQVQLYAVSTGTSTYTAEYPTNWGDGKIHQVSSGVWANNQTRADTLAERVYKWMTRSYSLQVEVDAGLALFGDDGLGLDLGDAVSITYDGTADNGGAGVHLQLSAAKFYVYGIDVRFNLPRKSARCTLTLEADNA